MLCDKIIQLLDDWQDAKDDLPGKFRQGIIEWFTLQPLFERCRWWVPCDIYFVKSLQGDCSRLGS